ncbi:Uma2 family endonuclease [Methylopila musalis]|uniref:Uma2 family endonuclease n=1 Tax=Methylopila musalis TaxID=1134781 RepID=A0ABW3Z7E6_9HYPH
MNVRHAPAIDHHAAELQPGMAVPVEAFLAWLDTQDGKHEYDRGTVGMMVRVTANHAKLVWKFVVGLTARLDVDRYQVFSESFGVRTGGSIRFPDILVQAPEPDGSALESKTPLVIVEVLSPSTAYTDHVVKRDEYLALFSLQADVVAEANAPKLTLWARGADGEFPLAPVEIEGLDATLPLDGLGVELPLAELYRGVSGPNGG